MNLYHLVVTISFAEITNGVQEISSCKTILKSANPAMLDKIQKAVATVIEAASYNRPDVPKEKS